MSRVKRALKAAAEALGLQRGDDIVLLGLAAIALAAYGFVSYGNWQGFDEWFNIYILSRGRPGFIGGRPLAMPVNLALFPIIGIYPLAGMALLTIQRVMIAFIITLIIRLFRPNQPFLALRQQGFI